MSLKNNRPLAITISIACLIAATGLIHFSFVAKLPKTYAVIFQEAFYFLIMYLLNKYLVFQKTFWKVRCALRELFFVLMPIYLYAALAIALSFIKGPSKLVFPLIVGISTALFEEYYFRGIILSSLLSLLRNKKRNYINVYKIVIVASLIFSLMHLVNLSSQTFYSTLLQMLQVFFLGMLLCALYIRTGSLFIPFLFHFLLNFIATLSQEGAKQTNTSVSWKSTLFVCFFYFIITVILLRRKKLNTQLLQ